MATAYKIQVGPEDTGLLKIKQSEEVAAKATELLQRDLEVKQPPISTVSGHGSLN